MHVRLGNSVHHSGNAHLAQASLHLSVPCWHFERPNRTNFLLGGGGCMSSFLISNTQCVRLEVLGNDSWLNIPTDLQLRTF